METTNIAYTPAFRPNSDLDTYLRSFQAEEIKVAAVTASSQMDIRLVTQEGDKVTISLDAKAAAFYGSFESTEVNEAGAAYQKSEVTAALYEREMTFTVEGDLNQEEQRDIFKALKTLDRMMHHFSEGHLKPMLTGAKKLQGLDTIAGLEANLSYEKQVLVATQTQVSAEHTHPAIEPAPSSAQAQDVPMVDQTPVLQLLEEADAVAGEMAQTVAETQTPLDRMLSFVDQLLNDYRQQMAHFNPLGASIIDHIAGQLQDALAKFNGAVAHNAPAVE